MRDAPLNDAELQEALAGLPSWSVESAKLATRVELPTFLAAVAFVREVADIAEDLDHHPDIDIRWRTVTLAVSTHDSGNAITARDVALATRVDAIVLPG